MKNTIDFKAINILFFVFLLLLILCNHIYYQFFSDHISFWAIITIEILLIALWLFLARKWVSGIRKGFTQIIDESISDTDLREEICSCIDRELFPIDIIGKLIFYQNKQEKKQKALLEKLKSNNLLLERNSKITDSIMHITSEILSSGEIDEILQTILDKAIEIIPNAQKGSILIYNEGALEFRAIHGYDFDVLKNLRFGLDELFQYNSKDFYEPCIVTNLESFNKGRLEEDKYDMLREGRGFELKSVLSCAIQVDNEFYGIINLDNTKEEHTFTKEDKPLIKHLATQIGLALKNARLIEKILFLSRHDSLTGIYNRCYFEELLMRIFQQYKASGSVFSLAILDINDLKAINDSYGHEAGDLLLRKFVQGISSHLDKEDVFARYGGDEFAIIFSDKCRAKAESIIENARTEFEKNPFTYCGKQISAISFGCGITEFPAETGEYHELVRLADTRMYKEKRKRKKPIR